LCRRSATAVAIARVLLRWWRRWRITAITCRRRSIVTAIRTATICGLWRLRHGRLEQGLVIAARLDELLIQLGKVVFLLRVFPNKLDQFRTYGQGRVIELRDLFIIAPFSAVCA